MLLKALEMHGFKSFPDKTVLEFGKGITSVVGPNGSGKSNISDAVRWVLGEQSTKSLRGAKMEDVIFSGTNIRKAQGFAEVTLRLDNTDRSLNDCDRDEVSVTRRYYRSGDSQYLLNGEECLLRDIHELFMDTGLGRDGYSIVGQGKIADLVSAKSSQRRDILEEAAGISHYRYRRNNTLRTLDRAEENLVRLRDILSVLEERVGPLKVQSEKAKKAAVLMEQKKQLEVGLWVNTIEKSREGLKEKEDKLSIVSGHYSDVSGELEEISARIDEESVRFSEISTEIENQRAIAAESDEQATETEGRIAVEKANAEHNEETAARIRADMAEAGKSTAHIEEQLNQANDEIAQAEKIIADKRARLDELVRETESIKGDDSDKQSEAGKISEEISSLTRFISDCRVEKANAESAIDELKSRIAAIDEVLKTRSGAVDALQQEYDGHKKELNALEETASQYENSISGYELIIGKKEEKAEALRTETDNINLEIYQKKARIKMLDDLEKNMDGYAGAVQKVMKESKRGTIRGIRGTVSQLINAEGKYAVAVETALGAAIQNVVTEKETDAKRAITFLKDNRAGRATFLPMDAIQSKPFTEKGLDSCDGFCGMADTLLTYDAEYDEIMKYLLSHVAVVEDIDDAIAMADKYSHRFKIVTLDGQVMNAGGSMTGGSRGSGVGFLSRQTEIDALAAEVDRMQKNLDGKLESLKALTEEINAARAECDVTEAELIKAQENVIRKESELDLVRDRINSAKDHLSLLEDEKKAAEDRIKENSLKSDKCTRDCDEAAAKSGELTDKLKQIDADRAALLEKREETALLQSRLNIEEAELRKEIEAKLAVAEECRARLADSGKKNDELLAEINEIEARNEEIASVIASLAEQAKQLREKAEFSRKEAERLVEARMNSEGDSTSLRSREKQLTADKEKLSSEMARLEEHKNSMQAQLENSLNKLYEEYELSFREARDLGIVIEDVPKANRELQEVRQKIKNLGPVNMGAIEEYQQVSEEYERYNTQITDVEKSKAELLRMAEELTEKMTERFREQFRLINNNFQSTFRELFDGGKAELVLEDPKDVLECNIEIKVQPPGKNVQNIDLLSGGEKSVSAIALLFAILKVTPAPFCIFDEVEAALDDVNVTRYAQYVRSMTGSTQFILITHRRGTMEEADVLYGVTMQEQGVSKLLELKTAEMAHKLGLTQ